MSEPTPPYDRDDLQKIDAYDASSPEEGDRKVLEQMLRMGANLALPRHAIYFLYFNKLETAQSAAVELRTHGYEANAGEKSQILSSNAWPVIAEKIAVVNEESVEQNRSFLTSFAERYSGEYDGWEAALDGTEIN